MSISDRKDGIRVKNLSGMEQLIMDINPKRCDSEVYINQEVDVTELVKYVEKKKKNGEDITFFHAFLAGLGKVLYSRKKLNYFIANRHVYEHKDVVISFAAKVQFSDNAEEMMLMVPLKEDDNINTISKRTKEIVDKIRAHHEEKGTDKKGANSAIDVVGKMPNIVRIPLVGFLKWMDKHGWLPSFLMEDDLYFSSMIISNLGPLHSGAIYHHLSEFGTCSALTTVGEIKDKVVVIDGKEQIRKICDFGITLDERIADGYYFIKSVQMFQEILNTPELLEENLSKKVDEKK